jgi:mannose-6-phosphate isomerase-like protein (cupin superfamily)
MLSPLNKVSEDNRRAIFEFGNGGNWKVCKLLNIKEDCVIGDHYHKNKDECFLLISGEADVILDGKLFEVEPFTVIDVPKFVHHTFNIKNGSLLLCLASQEHNPKDDHK